MSDTQYEVIKETFPKWAEKVETLARRDLNEHTMGLLYGMADGLILTGQCSEANDFVTLAIYKAKVAWEQKVKEARA